MHIKILYQICIYWKYLYTFYWYKFLLHIKDTIYRWFFIWITLLISGTCKACLCFVATPLVTTLKTAINRIISFQSTAYQNQEEMGQFYKAFWRIIWSNLYPLHVEAHIIPEGKHEWSPILTLIRNPDLKFSLVLVKAAPKPAKLRREKRGRKYACPM